MKKSLGRTPLHRYIIAFFGYAGYLGGHLIFPLILIPIWLVSLPFPGASRRFLECSFRAFLAFLTRFYLPFLGVYRIVELSGFDPAREPAVYVANHRSRIDGPLLLGLVGPSGVIMKRSYTETPLYRPFKMHLDFIPVDSTSRTALAAALEKAGQLFSRKKNLVVFPEGTRASTGRMLPFKDIAFRISSTCSVPVIPVIIHTELPFMTKVPGSYVPRFRFAVRVKALPSMATLPNERPAEFAARVERRIARELKKLDCRTFWET